MGTFQSRLKEERVRLGYNQADFAAAGGVGRTAQINYEKGGRSPDSEYLLAIGQKGADIAYILTGIRQLSGENGSLLENDDESRPRHETNDKTITYVKSDQHHPTVTDGHTSGSKDRLKVADKVPGCKDDSQHTEVDTLSMDMEAIDSMLPLLPAKDRVHVRAVVSALVDAQRLKNSLGGDNDES